MNDQILADKVRAILAKRDLWAIDMVTEIEALLPTPPPPPLPTLADMTPKERDVCTWMQADVETYRRAVIALPNAGGGRAMMLEQWGGVAYVDHDTVTPRPDLPRLEWPSDKKPAPTLPVGWRVADHKDNGRVIVTNPTPNRDGYVCYVLPADDYVLGYDWLLCKPYELTYLDTDDTERNRND